MKTMTKERPLFRSLADVEGHGTSILIPCQPRNGRRFRWLVVAALLMGLWGVGMAGQLASQNILHQGAPIVGP